MTSLSPAAPKRTFRHAFTPAPSGRGHSRPQRGVFLRGVHGTLLVGAGLLVVALIGLLDCGSETHLSLSILYLLPVAACAWCGGFAPGVLLALAGSLSWHLVDLVENPALPVSARVWNGVIRFATLALMSSVASRLRVSMLRERLLARTDPLTGAANGRTFYEAAAAEAERCRRSLRPVTLAYFDLDDFKLLNDGLGHAVGDQALRCVVETIQLHLRNADLLARLGGDEFALLLPETAADGAATLLTRLQEQLTHEMNRRGWPVTLSVGAVTFLRPLADIDLMIQRVDSLMYGAKRKGKARVEYAVVEEAEAASSPGVDRRATARAICHRTARVRCRDGHEEHEEFAAVRDISAGGIGLRLDARLPDDTLIVVEPLAPGARTLLARVRRATPDGAGWKHGCELSTRLSPQELHFWLGEQEKAAAPSEALEAGAAEG